MLKVRVEEFILVKGTLNTGGDDEFLKLSQQFAEAAD